MLARNLRFRDPDRNIDYEADVEYEPSTLEFFIVELTDAVVWHGKDAWPLARVIDDPKQKARMLEALAVSLDAEIAEALQRMVTGERLRRKCSVFL